MKKPKPKKKPTLSGGRNIAMKVPPHQWKATVAFYRDVLGMEEIEHGPTDPPSVGFVFGSNRLWIDCVKTASQAELWLELTTTDVRAAAKHLRSAGVVRCDDIEPLDDDFDGFWIQNPASIVHLVASTDQD